ncbi:MAG: CdvA-like protein [Thaumarchaeota archaeon]|nr:CdvA-like protein [Nitrososphaerota archaeon]
MDTQLAGHLLSMPVKDIYGRNMGEIVGVIFSLEGKIESIGVGESAGKFAIYPGNRLARHASDILVIPEWRMEAQSLARQKESLARREKAIEELSRCQDLDPRVFEEVATQIEAARATNERLKQKVESRLRELEGRHQSVTDFVGIAKVQHATTEIDEWAYAVTAEFGKVQLETDARELDELRSAMGYLEDIEARQPQSGAEPLPRPQTTFPPVMFDLLPELDASKDSLDEIPA